MSLNLSDEDKKYIRLLVLAELEIVISDASGKNEELPNSTENNFLTRLREAIDSRKERIIESNFPVSENRIK